MDRGHGGGLLAQWVGLLCQHRRISPMVKSWLHAEKAMFLRSWDEQQQLKPYDASMVVGREFGRGLPQLTAGAAGSNAVPPSSRVDDDDDGSKACS